MLPAVDSLPVIEVAPEPVADRVLHRMERFAQGDKIALFNRRAKARARKPLCAEHCPMEALAGKPGVNAVARPVGSSDRLGVLRGEACFQRPRSREVVVNLTIHGGAPLTSPMR